MKNVQFKIDQTTYIRCRKIISKNRGSYDKINQMAKIALLKLINEEEKQMGVQHEETY